MWFMIDNIVHKKKTQVYDCIIDGMVVNWYILEALSY
jgi:O-succinylbenzoate synthase